MKKGLLQLILLLLCGILPSCNGNKDNDSNLSQDYINERGKWSNDFLDGTYFIHNYSNNTFSYKNSEWSLMSSMHWANGFNTLWFEGSLNYVGKDKNYENLTFDVNRDAIIVITNDKSIENNYWSMPVKFNLTTFMVLPEVVMQKEYEDFLSAISQSETFTIKVPLNTGETVSFDFISTNFKESLVQLYKDLEATINKDKSKEMVEGGDYKEILKETVNTPKLSGYWVGNSEAENRIVIMELTETGKYKILNVNTSSMEIGLANGDYWTKGNIIYFSDAYDDGTVFITDGEELEIIGFKVTLLRKSKEEFNTIINQLPEGVW